jgi:transposase
MGRAEVLQGVRAMRFEALLDRHERGGLSQLEAAEMLGIGERTFRRWRDRLRDEGVEGLRDRRIGKPSSRRAAAEEIVRMLGLYEASYADFTVKHFHDQMVKRHGYKLGYTVTRLALQGAGLVRPAPKRSAHRNHLVASVHWPGMPNSLALEQMQVLAEEVMPMVRHAA